MKKMMLVSLITLISGMINAQSLEDTQVPAAVKGTFAKGYPKAKEVKWSKEGLAVYEAEFLRGGTKMAVNYDPSGKWLVTERAIAYTELSPEIKEAIRKNFDGYRIQDAEKANSASDGRFYEVTLKKDGVGYELRLSGDGKVLKKEELKDAGE